MPGTAPDLPVHVRRDGVSPDPELGRVRQSPGLQRTVDVFGQPAWLVSRYDDARAVLGEPELFTVGDSVPAGLSGAQADDGEAVPMLVVTDPPEHTRLRRALTGAFTMRSVRQLEPRIVEVVDEHLAAMADAGSPVDLVASFALPVPSMVICELLGVVYADRLAFQADVQAKFNFNLSDTERQAASARLGRRFRALVDAARREPGDDLLGRLVQQRGEELSGAELTGIANILVEAGFETTANMIALSALTLLQHPDQADAMRDDPAAVSGAVEELLRFLSVVQIIPSRRATRDIAIAGQHVADGDLCVVALPSANRDTALLADPDVLNTSREPVAHLAFGHGIHHCLGAALARAELGIALPALLRCFPDLKLDGDPADLEHRTGSVVHGVRTLPVTWGQRGRPVAAGVRAR